MMPMRIIPRIPRIIPRTPGIRVIPQAPGVGVRFILNRLFFRPEVYLLDDEIGIMVFDLT
jgi:hypothetical protein